jgi:hypothetical protein
MAPADDKTKDAATKTDGDKPAEKPAVEEPKKVPLTLKQGEEAWPAVCRRSSLPGY